MRALIFDPGAGVAGDMTLAALLDLGVGEQWLREFVASLELGPIDLHVERVRRCGIEATYLRFDIPESRAHRHLRHLLEIVDRSVAPARAKERAADAFRRIAVAEAAVHGTTIEKVHFHEVGALDSILDVLCTMAAVEELGCEAFFTRPVAVGSGTVQIEHGRYPVPAPATLRLLEGVPTTGYDLEGECTTPTGAALIATLTGGQGVPREVVVLRGGYGAGTRDSRGHPNVLRLILADVAEPAPAGLLLLQADIDDLAPEYVGAALDAVLAAGALDAVALPVAMKKGRPGSRLEALAPASRLQDVASAILRNTTTIGLRHWPVSRTIAERAERIVSWRGQQVRVKMVQLPDGTTRGKPEYEDVARAAAALGLPPFEVRQALERELPPNASEGV